MSGVTTHYFSHDADARHDPKIVCMMNVFGMEGYGIYWCVVEILREEDKFRYKIDNKYWAEGLAGECKVTKEKMVKFIDFCVEIDLLQRNEKYFWSESLNRRMGRMVMITESNKRAVNIRWKRHREKQEAEVVDEIKEFKELTGSKEKEVPYNPAKILLSFRQGKFVGITEMDIVIWQKQYPFLDIQEEIFQMEQYWIDNKEKAKEKKDTWRTVINNRFYYKSKSFEGDKSVDYTKRKELDDEKEQAEYSKQMTQKRILEIRKEKKEINPNISGLIQDTLDVLKGR